MTHETKLTRLSGTAFRRAATHFPTTPVSVETAELAMESRCILRRFVRSRGDRVDITTGGGGSTGTGIHRLGDRG